MMAFVLRLLGNWRLLLLLGVGTGIIWLVTQRQVLLAEIESQKNRVDAAELLVKTWQGTINDIQVRQSYVTSLDEKYTKEIADAQAVIDQLQRDVYDGRRRLQLNAKCPKPATSTTSMDDAGRARLTDSAERDYWTLRSRIGLAGKQIAGLQQYIREQCLK